MRTILFATALMLGTAAVAQDTGTQPTTTDAEEQTDTQAPDAGQTTTTTTTDTGTGTTGGTMQSGTTGGSMQGSSMSAQGGGGTVAPGNSNPERDARGIPVVSAPATAPAGANQMMSAPAGAQMVPAPNQSAVFTTRPATGEYPVCSRTVTDGCVQNYEGRGRARRR